MPRADVAREYRVSPSAIGVIMKRVKEDKGYIRELASKNREREKAREQLAEAVEQMVDQDLHISSVGMLKAHLKETKDIDVKDWLLQDVMKRELDLRYKRIKEISW